VLSPEMFTVGWNHPTHELRGLAPRMCKYRDRKLDSKRMLANV
jgi:hypothetical protein